ncbi:MAG: alpha-hydroxy-acid oxidizing protein [Alphaproteobacteria bacterium]|nr:alpha-hydroxy-acid oxidizing protein [Alphaproteobacteria bacterium]
MTDSTAASISPPDIRWGDVRMATSGRLARALTAEDLRLMARRRLPRPIFDYVDGGGENEFTLGRNSAAFDRIGFRPRTVADIAGRSQSTAYFGRASAAPFAIGPMGGLGLLCPDADIVLARVAARAGIPFVLATGASASIERVAEAAPDGRRWFQLYVFSDADLNRRLLQRAASAGFEALVVTTDTQIAPKRLRDLRNGFAMPMRLTPRNIVDFAARPGWLWRIGRKSGTGLMGNLAAEIGGTPTAAETFDFFRAGRSRSVGWEDLKPIRDVWRGPMLLKGIVTAEEAVLAAELGVDGIVVSNHGGRNLDGTMATIEALPQVVAAVGDRLTVFLDSGIRRGSDVVKALALGAKGTLIGRPIAFALAAAGEAGVEHVLAMLHDEVDRVHGLLGCPRLDRIDPSFLWRDDRPARP